MNDLVNSYDLHTAIRASLESLHPRDDRYTVLNEQMPSAEECERMTNLLYAEVTEHANEYSRS